MAGNDAGSHNEACATASARSPCLCNCHGARHGEGMAAFRSREAASAVRGRARDAADSPVTDLQQDAPAAHEPIAVRSATPSREALDAMSDEQLDEAFAEHSLNEDWDAVDAVAGEMDRRDAARQAVAAWVDEPAPARERTGEAWLDGPDGADEQWSDLGADDDNSRRVDELVARGYSFQEAYAEVHDIDPEVLRRQELNAAVDLDRRSDETRERAVRRAYDTHVHEQMVAAEAATRGHMLSPRGQREGINPIELFSGPPDRARAYASEDLQRWWASNGRQTYTEFRAAALGWRTDLAGAATSRIAGNGRDFI